MILVVKLALKNDTPHALEESVVVVIDPIVVLVVVSGFCA